MGKTVFIGAATAKPQITTIAIGGTWGDTETVTLKIARRKWFIRALARLPLRQWRLGSWLSQRPLTIQSSRRSIRGRSIRRQSRPPALAAFR